jgi:Na+-translocating ferredoxin:NAD+ oxidoreductase RnfA subunit
MRGRVFTVLMSTNYAVLGLAMIAAGPLTNEFGARWVWGVSASLAGVAAIVGYVMARGIRDIRVVETERVAGVV